MASPSCHHLAVFGKVVEGRSDSSVDGLRALSLAMEHHLAEDSKVVAQWSCHPPLLGATRPLELVPTHVQELTTHLASFQVPQLSLHNDLLRDILENNRRWSEFAGLATDQAAGVEDEEEEAPPAPQERDPATIPVVAIQPLSAQILQQLRIDPKNLFRLTPGQFEILIAEVFDKMGFDPILTGGVNRPDGGVDIIAVPRVRHGFGCLIAVQCEHHRVDRKTGRRKVGDLLRWRGGEVFQMGALVTNTEFTKHARFEAAQSHNRAFLKLRDFNDVARWIRGNYDASKEWSEMPAEIRLGPDLVIPLPRPRPASPR